MSEVQRISYKTVSKAELGLSKSNMTHIGYATHFIDEWKKKFSFKTKLTIFFDDDKSTSITSLFINDPIENKDGSLRSPKFRSLNKEENTTSLRDSILYYYKLNMRDTIATPLLILFNLEKSEHKVEAFLISTGHKIFKKLFSKLSYPLTHRNNKGEINSKLITTNKYSEDFRKLSNFYKDIYLNKESLDKVENDETIKNNFNIEKIRDERSRTTTVKTRVGQQSFRINVLAAYHYKCCITGSDLIEAIETNHIYEYRGPNTNHIQNGIPLRADIHKLWTRGLLGITREYKVILHNHVKNSKHYKDYEGIKIQLPTNSNYHPDKKALDRWCKLHNLSN